MKKDRFVKVTDTDSVVDWDHENPGTGDGDRRIAELWVMR
jgi:hypothetical protein